MKVAYCICLLLAFFFGSFLAGKKKEERPPLRPEIVFPVIEEKPIALIVYAHKNEKICERTLRSIFEQDYENFRVIFYDDHSQDGTFETVRSFVVENKQEHRVILIKNPERIGPVSCVYQAASTLHPHEIAIPLDVKDWLTHPNVLSALNSAFQNPDVWVVKASSILYPSYECQFASDPIAFYASFFQKMRLADLMQDGHFMWNKDAYLKPLLQMSEGKQRVIEEPLFVINCARPTKDVLIPSAKRYEVLNEMAEREEGEADIVLFSCNRPLQLFACLESIHTYMSGYERIFVLCRADDERYRASYGVVEKFFPKVEFIFQGEKYKKDFKPLLLKILSTSDHPYILFGTDDDLVKDFVDLHTCMEMMAKTGAYGFYLRLGSHICHSYQMNREQKVPLHVSLEKEVRAWNIQIEDSDWGFPNTLDMTVYRKSALKEAFETMRYKTPNSLEFCWAKDYQPKGEVGLFFEHSKVLNLPLNVVGRTGNPHMDFLTAPELLEKFEQGLKFDLQPLFRVENNSPHFEYRPEWTQL